MNVAPGGGTPVSQLEALEKHWNDFDFFFYHYKKADTAGEDGRRYGSGHLRQSIPCSSLRAAKVAHPRSAAPPAAVKARNRSPCTPASARREPQIASRAARLSAR